MRQPRFEKDQIANAQQTGRPLFAMDIYDRFSATIKGRRQTIFGVLEPNIEPSVRHARLAMNAADSGGSRQDFAEKVIGTRTKLRETGDPNLPFTDDEERVVRYLMELTGGEIGAGTDPIGFLIASHANLKRLVADRKP